LNHEETNIASRLASVLCRDRKSGRAESGIEHDEGAAYSSCEKSSQSTRGKTEEGRQVMSTALQKTGLESLLATMPACRAINLGRTVPQSSLLTIVQAAAHLGISAKWLYRNYRNLPHVLIGNGKKPRIRFRRTDLDNWISTHTIDWRAQ